MSDLGNLLAFHTSPLELIVRGSAMYWFLLLIFRFVLRRDPGSLGVADILFVVIVADAAQNGMSGSYDTLAEGFVLVGTLAGWNYLLDWAGYRWPAIHKLTEPPPLCWSKTALCRGATCDASSSRQTTCSPNCGRPAFPTSGW
jgi:hypothetical protein